MSPRANDRLATRAADCGMLAAGTNIPLTFQRTLMPRRSTDQVIITGLAISTNTALVTLLQESIQAGALLLQRRKRHVGASDVSRTTVLLDLTALGAGLIAQSALRQRAGEPLFRAAGRTAGFWTSVAGAAGAIVGGLDETLNVSDRGRRRAGPAVLAATATLAGIGELWRRRRTRLDVGLPRDESHVQNARALAFGIAVSAGMTAVSATERHAADRIARGVARVLPGDAALWRPLGHAISFAATVGAGRLVTQQAFARIEHRQGAVETAFDIPPPTPKVSGSFESHVPFATLSLQGRRFVWMTTPEDIIEKVTGEHADAQPIRVYVGLASAPTEAERVDLALRELERTGAFEREWLMIVSPTGTGYVNYAAVSALEFLAHGNCATVAMQYAARPSVLSLRRVAEGRAHMQLLLDGLRERLARASTRPQVVLFGESLGAWTSQDPFCDRGTQGLTDAGIDKAIWIGTPHFSKWKEQILRDDRADVDRSVVGVFNDIGEWHALDEATRRRLRFVMITHHDDGVALFGPELAIQAPEWLGAPSKRPSAVPKGMRWVPTTTFFQVLVDMKNSANVVPGVFAAAGHDYRADLLPFFDAVLGFDRSSVQLAAIGGWLEMRERQRTEWLKVHGDAGASLSVAVLERLMQRERAAGHDTDAALLQLIRDVASREHVAG